MKLHLPIRDLLGRPGRMALLALLTALLALAVLAGTLIVTSLRTGLGSLSARLGADIMVVPYEATTQSDLKSIVLQGATGYFYMDSDRAEKIMAREGIARCSTQLFLASASAGCCSVPVQIIGFDPETDFTITPWIRRSGGGELGLMDVVVGNDLNAFVGDVLTFYGVQCHVAAKLDKTGTSFDTAVFASTETIQALIAASLEKGMNTFEHIDPDKVVSCVLIDVADGYVPEEVAGDIDLHVKKVRAIQTKEMMSGISDSLTGMSDIIGILIAAVWVLGAAVLLVAFTMSVNARRKEFAVLRIVGASRGRLAWIVLCEALLTGLVGGIAGAAAGLVIVLPFSNAIGDSLGMPFLLPSVGTIAVYTVLAVAAAALTGAAAAGVSAWRISRIDAGLIVRGDNG